MKQAKTQSRAVHDALRHGAHPLGILPVILLAAIGASAEPGRTDLLESGNPLLKKAITYDLELAPDGIGNQDMAEQYYLEFIEKNPDSPLIPYIYNRLANNFVVWFTEERVAAGNRPQREKGQHYWEMAVKAYPRNEDGEPLLGQILFRSMINAASCSTDFFERVGAYAEIYKMLRDLTEEDVRNRLWLSEREISANQPLERLPEPIREFEEKHPGVLTEEDKLWLNPPDAFERAFDSRVESFMGVVERSKEIMVEQMLGIAEHSREPEKTELLQLIAKTLPGDKPGILASQKLDAVPAASQPPAPGPS